MRAEFGHIAFRDGKAKWHAVLGLPAGTRFGRPTDRSAPTTVAGAVRQAGRMGRHLSHPLAVTLRNTAMRLTPSRAGTRMILRHHAWVAPSLN